MKKHIVLTIILTTFSLGLLTQAQANDAGCGIGSLIVQKNSKLSQLFAVTLNVTTLTEFLGITSGTSNCSANGIVFQEKEAGVFAEANLPSLKIEMARGEGESLSAFAEILGCQSSDMKAFGSMTRNHYQSIFPTPNVSTSNFVNSILNEIKKNPELKSSCRLS